MKHLTLTKSLTTFNTLFASAEHEMFKAEVLQDYTAVDDSPSLRAWLQGDKEKSRQLGKTDPVITSYRNMCLSSPAKITRVHVVKTPYTPYLAWEVEICYKNSLLAHNAETVMLVDINNLRHPQPPAGDFWIFDSTRVLQWEYENGVGKTIGAQVWDKTTGDDISYFLQLKDALLHAATPL